MQDAPSTTLLAAQPEKSVPAALVLAFLFGPLGLLYASVWGGIILIITAILTLPLTAGLAALVLWPVSMIWAAMAAMASKRKAA